MEKLNFNLGIREYQINDNPNCIIRISTTDLSILERIKQSTKHIEQIEKKYENVKINNANEAGDFFVECDKAIRSEIDFIFNAEVSDMIFGNMNCLSPCNGQPVYVNFLNAIIPFIKKDIEGEQAKSKENMEKYISQVKGLK